MQGRAPAPDPASATALSMLCGPSVAAVVLLAQPGGMVPLRVAFFAPGEEKESPKTWPWAESRHLVFRRASALAAAALQHFSSTASLLGSTGTSEQQGNAGWEAQELREPHPSPLEMLLLWLATYTVRRAPVVCLG